MFARACKYSHIHDLNCPSHCRNIKLTSPQPPPSVPLRNVKLLPLWDQQAFQQWLHQWHPDFQAWMLWLLASIPNPCQPPWQIPAIHCHNWVQKWLKTCSYKFKCNNALETGSICMTFPVLLEMWAKRRACPGTVINLQRMTFPATWHLNYVQFGYKEQYSDLRIKYTSIRFLSTVSLFKVSVPVLSLHSTSILAISSMAVVRFVIAPCFQPKSFTITRTIPGFQVHAHNLEEHMCEKVGRQMDLLRQSVGTNCHGDR